MQKQVKILVVDDEATQLLLRCLMLNSLGFMNLCEAKNGNQALELLRASKFDLVISDVNMPVLSGFGLLKAMATDGILVDTPVIMVTGESHEANRVYAMHLGASAYLLKPVGSEELYRAIKKALG